MTGSIGSVWGMPVHTSPYAEVKKQFRFPKTKKKRILKKFKKNEANYKMTPICIMFDPSAMGMSGSTHLVMHPSQAEFMRTANNPRWII
jgi:hypothetical protein